MPPKPATIDDYLKQVAPAQRAALQKLRTLIKAAAPKAEECISYQVPAFRLNGLLVGFGARADYCAFYPMNGTLVEAFKTDLEGFKTSKGMIRFQPDHPIPDALVKKMVKVRIAENSR